MRKIFNIVLLALFSIIFAQSQTVANLQVGTLLVGNSGNDFSFRPGYSLDIRVRIGSPGFFMCPGLSFQKFTISEYQKNKYFNNRPSYSIVKINLNAGFENKFYKLVKYRIFAGLDLNYLLLIDNNDKNVDFNYVYDAFVGYDYGFGLSFGFITLDLKYEDSFTEFYKDTNKTKLNFKTISLGIAF